MRASPHILLPLSFVVIASACSGSTSTDGTAAPGASTDRADVAISTQLEANQPSSVPAEADIDPAPPATSQTPVTTIATVATTAPTAVEPAPSTAPPATTAPPPEYVAEPSSGTLRNGMQGPRTQQLQRDLIRVGYLPEGSDDGQFGSDTEAAVREAQEELGPILGPFVGLETLSIDGIAGPNTLSVISYAIAEMDGEFAEPTTDGG